MYVLQSIEDMNFVSQEVHIIQKYVHGFDRQTMATVTKVSSGIDSEMIPNNYYDKEAQFI